MKFSNRLLIAIANDDLKLFKSLTNKNFDLLITDNSDWTLLHWAAQEGADEIGKWLLKKKPELLNRAEKFGQTSLRIAAAEGNTSMVLLLLKEGASIDSPGDTENGSVSETATAYGHEEIALILSIAAENRDLLFE